MLSVSELMDTFPILVGMLLHVGDKALIAHFEPIEDLGGTRHDLSVRCQRTLLRDAATGNKKEDASEAEGR